MLICENLTVGYGGKKTVENLSFNVNSGDYLCIVGENGSGKTTLMKTILGLLPSISGKITANHGGIGYLPQQTEAEKDFPASVFEIVLSGCINKKPFYTKPEKQKAQNALEKLGIEKLARVCYKELSGGQQQRVLLARALCAAKEMLLLDEPVSALDPKVKAEMYQLIAELNKNDKITVIMISHDIGEAVKYASHILHIGDSLFFGTTEEYLKSEIYLDKGGEQNG